MTPHFFSLLLKLLPLIRGKDLLQLFVGLPPNLRDSGLRLFSQRLELLSGIAEYLMNLGFLIGVELKRINHLLKTIATRLFTAAAMPSLVSVQSESAGREAQQENYNRRDPHLPFASVANIHDFSRAI